MADQETMVAPAYGARTIRLARTSTAEAPRTSLVSMVAGPTSFDLGGTSCNFDYG